MSPTTLIAESPNQVLTMVQTCLEKGQSLHKCVGFSGLTPHNLHMGSFGQFLLIKLFAMRIFLCSKVYAKNLHFDSALAFQIGMMRSLQYDPSN
jgi:hypothetical protein